MRAIYQKTFNKKFVLGKEKIRLIELNHSPFQEERGIHDHTKTSLGPWSDSYASSLNHINLYEVVSLKQIAKFPC